MNDIESMQNAVDPLSVHAFDLRVQGYVDPELAPVAADVLEECVEQLTSIGATLLGSEAELPPEIAARAEQARWRQALEQQRAAAATRYALSAREAEVMALVSDGLSDKAIAEQLTLSSNTVRSHLRHVSQRMGTGERTRMAALFNGVILP